MNCGNGYRGIQQSADFSPLAQPSNPTCLMTLRPVSHNFTNDKDRPYLKMKMDAHSNRHPFFINGIFTIILWQDLHARISPSQSAVYPAHDAL